MKSLYEKYLLEEEAYKSLWNLFGRNALEIDFRRSLYAAVGMFVVPTAFNLYFIFHNPLLKNSVI